MTLPDKWERAKLGDLLQVISGFAFKSGEYQDRGHFLIRIGNVQDSKINLNNPRFVSLSTATSRFELAAGDILTSLTGNIGRVARVEEAHLPAALNQRVAKLQPATSLSEDGYLYRFLSSAAFREPLSSHGQGAAQQNVSSNVIEDIFIPLPPLAEQRRIVVKLDAMTARLARARAALNRVPVLAERLRVTGLERAFEGRLFPDADGGRLGWKTVAFEEAGEIASNLVPPTSILKLPHIAPNHIRSGRPVLLPFQTIAEDGVISGKHRFYAGQLIYSKIRPYLRKVVLVNFEGGCSADMYPINPRCDARYLMYWMLSPQFTWLATRQEGRTVLPKINQNALNAIPTPLAPTAMQKRIAAALDAIFARADRLEAEAARAIAMLDRLEAAILAKAFRGELVPQDPNDEPASVLLDRIRAECVAVPKPKRGRRPAPVA